MTQLDIWAPPTTLDQAFWTFHKRNPRVLDRLIQMTEQAKRAGKRKVGMKMLFEVIRWEHFLQTEGDSWKMNNSYTSRYVRLIQEQRPDLAGMFEVRRIRS